MHAEWIAAGAAVFVAISQAAMAFLVLQIRDNVHQAIEQFRAWTEATFETKELAEKREQLLNQRIQDLTD